MTGTDQDLVIGPLRYRTLTSSGQIYSIARMHQIDVYGFADREICAGCDGNCADSHCAPGAKRPTAQLVKEFEGLIKEGGLPVSVCFYEASDENIARHGDVQRLLGMADLSPVIILDGKVLFLGGFSPEGLRDELVKRLANGA